MFNPLTIVRKASVIHEALEEVVSGENTMLVAKKQCKIYIPKRFHERELASIGQEIYIPAIYCITIDDKYFGVSSACARMKITPDVINIVDVFGEPNYEFTFEKGSIVTPNVMLVKKDTYVYQIYAELISRANVPWFFNIVDMARVMETCSYHGNINLSPSNIAFEIIVSTMARNAKDRKQYYRHIVESIYDLKNPNPVYLTSKDVIYGTTNLTAKLMGAYLDDGIVSALVNPSEKVEPIETALRM